MLTVVALLVLGVLVARAGLLPEGSVKVLDQVVLRLSLPGLVLARLPDLDLAATALVPVAVAWGTLALLAVLVLAAARVLALDRRTTGTLLLVVPLGNTSFLGIPAVQALLGEGHVPYAVVYDQLGSFLALATFGTVVAARYGSGSSPTWGATLRRVATFPPFVALVAGLVARSTGLPAAVEDVAAALGATLTPLAMLTVGMRLAIPRVDALPPLLTGLALRLAVAPAAVFGIATALGALAGADAGAVAWQTSLLESAMPPMVTASVVASGSGLDGRLAAGLVGIGVLVAALSLPAWAALAT